MADWAFTGLVVHPADPGIVRGPFGAGRAGLGECGKASQKADDDGVEQMDAIMGTSVPRERRSRGSPQFRPQLASHTFRRRSLVT